MSAEIYIIVAVCIFLISQLIIVSIKRYNFIVKGCDVDEEMLAGVYVTVALSSMFWIAVIPMLVIIIIVIYIGQIFTKIVDKIIIKYFKKD